MKAKLALTAFSVLFAWGMAMAQTPDQRVTITKRVVEKDGSESTETIVKKGEAAKNFNIDQYLADNKADNVSLDIRSEGGDEERHIVINGRSSSRNIERMARDFAETIEESAEWVGDQNIRINIDADNFDFNDEGGNYTYNWSDCGNGAFLGVEEDSDEDEDEKGMVVQVVRGSAADKAGLRDNDMIMSLNGQETNRWSDLSGFIQKSNKGDKVKIVYRRNGKEMTADAVLATRNEIECVKTRQGFMGVSPLTDDDKNGAVVSICSKSAAEKAGLKMRDRIVKIDDTPINDYEDITDFMAYTQPGQVIKVTYVRKGEKSTVDITLGEQKSWDWQNSSGWGNSGDCAVDIQQKKACMGVYTGISAIGIEGRSGAAITAFTANSAAEDEKMELGDIITAVDDEPINNPNDLWDAIARYEPGEKVKITFERKGASTTATLTLRECEDSGSQVTIVNADPEGNGSQRRFYTWNWGAEDREDLTERRTITIHKGAEGDAPVVNAAPGNDRATNDRTLQLRAFKAYPNPSNGQITIDFNAETRPAIVSILDMNGRQLYREELNAFDGTYTQQFDLSEYAKGSVVIRIEQDGKAYTEQVVIN